MIRLSVGGDKDSTTLHQATPQPRLYVAKVTEHASNGIPVQPIPAHRRVNQALEVHEMGENACASVCVRTSRPQLKVPSGMQ